MTNRCQSENNLKRPLPLPRSTKIAGRSPASESDVKKLPEMTKLKSFLKYAGAIIFVLGLALASIIAYFLFKNNAPLLSGEVKYGIPYKDELKIDLYAPTKKIFEQSPVIIYVHGGAWIGGTKGAINFNRFNGAVNNLREKGYAVVCPDYTLANKEKSSFPDCILDIYDAIEWTKKNAVDYQLDTTNLGLWGESAGAQIAMMIAFADTTMAPKTYKKTKFNYLVDVYGPNDLASLYHGGTIEKLNATINRFTKLFGNEFDISQYVFGFDPLKDTVRAKDVLSRYSPFRLLKRNTFPTLIIHGDKDKVVPISQSLVMRTKMDSLDIPYELHALEGMDHSFIGATQSQRDSTQKWIEDFVVRNYQAPGSYSRR